MGSASPTAVVVGEPARGVAWSRTIAVAALAAVAYFVSARMGYAFAIPGGIVTLWPPSGVTLGLLVLSRRREWMAIAMGALIGSLASDLKSGYSPLLALGAAAANATESLVAAWLLTSYLRLPLSLGSVRAVVTFVIGVTVVSNAITAVLGAAVLTVGFNTPFLHAGFVWWAGDGLGMLLVAPVLMTARRLSTVVGTLLRAVEALVLTAAVLLAAHFSVGVGYRELGIGAYLTFPCLFLSAFRFGPLGAAWAGFLTAGVAIWSAALGVGPYSSLALSGSETTFRLYLYLTVVSSTALIFGAALEERQVASLRTAESDRRYRSVVETVTDAILLIDTDSIITFANAASERIFGYRPDELVGRSLTELMPPALREAHRMALGRYLATGQRHIAWQGVELIGLHRDGHEVPLEVSFSEVKQGDQRRFTGIIRDVTEKRRAQQSLREAEERMRFSLEAARLGVWESDLTTGRTHWSQTLESLHGLAPGTFDRTYEAFLDRVHPDDRAAVRSGVEAGTQSRADFSVLYRTTWPDGSVHWISGFGRTFCDDEGKPIRAAGIGMDVTERRAMEEQSLQTQKMETIGQLAGGVAHDFNNLLTAILGHAMLAAEALGRTSPLQTDLMEIRLAAERATALTGQLLAFSRRQILSPRVMGLGDSVTLIAPMLQRLIGEQIEITVSVARDVGRVLADPGQIDQVILNLAVNARDAMPNGGRLTIDVRNQEVDDVYARQHKDVMPGRYVMMAVTDTGVGMDAQTQARVFEPFFTTKAKGRGTGLGLSTVYGVVKQSAGHIRVESQRRRGSTFAVYLPRVDADVEAAATAPVSAATRGTEAVLVVEDDERIRRLVHRVLTNRGYRVSAAAAPEEALAIARHGSHFDLLVTDVVLPGMSGRALAEKLGAICPQLLVLYMSGYTDDAIGRYGVLEVGVALLEKPFTPDALLKRVRETLEARPTGRAP